MKLDVLAIAAHPDDAELSCSGVLLNEKLKGRKTGIVDLTQGELGTRGTAETRKAEAAAAAAILQLDVRDNLQLADGFFTHSEESLKKVIQAIRKYQPEIILCNAPEDRHPDHGKGASLAEDAAFLAGLRKIETYDRGVIQPIWKPAYVFNYIQDRYLHPNFVVDITNVMDIKIESIKAYATQFFNPDLNEPQTYISTPEFIDGIVHRANMLGKMIGVKYAEGFISKKMIGIHDFDALIKQIT